MAVLELMSGLGSSVVEAMHFLVSVLIDSLKTECGVPCRLITAHARFSVYAVCSTLALIRVDLDHSRRL